MVLLIAPSNFYYWHEKDQTYCSAAPSHLAIFGSFGLVPSGKLLRAQSKYKRDKHGRENPGEGQRD